MGPPGGLRPGFPYKPCSNRDSFEEVETHNPMTNRAQTPHAQTNFLQLDSLCLQVNADFEAAAETSRDWIDEPCKMPATHGKKLWPTCNAGHDPYDRLVCRNSKLSRLIAVPIKGLCVKQLHTSKTSTLEQAAWQAAGQAARQAA